MLIRIEDPIVGSIEIGTHDNASMGKVIGAIAQAINIFIERYDGRDQYDFLSVLSACIKDLRNPDDEPAKPV